MNKNSTNNYNDQQTASHWYGKFKQSMVAKSEMTKEWQVYKDAYSGEYFKDDNKPEYKSNEISNYIFSIIETQRPIMVDNNPKFQALPRTPNGMIKSSDVQDAFLYEWDREDMSAKLYRELINILVLGNSLFFIPWNSNDKNVKAIPINPFNIFPDPLATNIDDSEYFIYAKYMHENKLKKEFPDKAEMLSGTSINYSELVNNNDEKAVQINNQILVLEVWCHDWTTIEVEDGGYKKKKFKYPNGRVITLAPEQGVVLSDKENPYEDGKFPFVHLKCYDLPGKFWGEGEVKQLLSPQKYLNDLNNQILDNIKATANMPWIVDNNAGIGVGKLSNRPGIVIRKNPGSEVRRDAPPNMPVYVKDKGMEFKDDMEQISGIFDSLKGNGETGVYTAQGILALQEAGQARIRLKVKLMELALGKMASIWYSRMQQFWSDERFIRVSGSDGSYNFKSITPETLMHDYDIQITAGSTMPVNRSAMLDLMIRLAQTPAEDGRPMVDRQAVIDYLPVGDKEDILKRMNGQGTQMQQQMQQMEQSVMEVMEVIEQLSQAVEDIGGDVGQMHQENAKIKEEEKNTELKDKGYNEGYSDAEKQLQQMQGEGDMPQQPSMPSAPPSTGMETPEQFVEQPMQEQVMQGEGDLPMDIPPEVLEGLESLSEDELALVLQKYPQLADIINSL